MRKGSPKREGRQRTTFQAEGTACVKAQTGLITMSMTGMLRGCVYGGVVAADGKSEEVSFPDFEEFCMLSSIGHSVQ